MLDIETEKGGFPITFVYGTGSSTQTYKVILLPTPTGFEAKEVRYASGEKVVGDIKYYLITEAERLLRTRLAEEAEDNKSVGKFSLYERVLVAYYYTLAKYIQEGRKITVEPVNTTILWLSAKQISDRIKETSVAAEIGGHKKPTAYFEERTRNVLAEIRKGRENQAVFWDDNRWECFYMTCLARVFDWRGGKISKRYLRLAKTIMPEHDRRTIREAGG